MDVSRLAKTTRRAQGRSPIASEEAIKEDRLLGLPWTRHLVARHVPLLAVILTVALLASPAGAQRHELSTADRLRMLYTTQLTFTPEGDPIVRLGLLEGEKRILFTPNEDFRVLPSGDSGPVIELPGGRQYTVSIADNKPGEYKHWVVVERLPIDQRERLDEVKKSWLSRGQVPRVFEVGGLFAVRGKVFDSRVILLAVGGMSSRRKANDLQRKLQARHGIEGGIHSELVEYPTGVIKLEGDGVRAVIRHRDILQISPMPGREEAIRYKIPGIKKSYTSGTETRTYTGGLAFAPDKGGELVVINSLGAERALKGTVPAEIFASAPKNALQAQAIAARNEIFSAIGVRNLADPYMLRADIYDQVYGGVGAEDRRTSAAVDATRGKVMFYGNQIVEAFFSSNAGGFTENNENVWDMEPRPYLRGRPDAPREKVPGPFRDGITEKELDRFLDEGFDAFSKIAPVSSSKLFRWNKSVKASVPQRWLEDAGHKVGRIKDINIKSRGVSGRVIQLEIIGERGKALVERELNVRRLFGGLRSGLFTMDIRRDGRGFISDIAFKGAGFGHGVGMCQTGAVGMASKGHSAEDILGHYYKGITVKDLY